MLHLNINNYNLGEVVCFNDKPHNKKNTNEYRKFFFKIFILLLKNIRNLLEMKGLVKGDFNNRIFQKKKE